MDNLNNFAACKFFVCLCFMLLSVCQVELKDL